jgi:hypothetical protein
MRRRYSGFRWLFVFSLLASSEFLLLATPVACRAQSETPVFTATFDSDLNASPGAPNRFSASNLVEVVEFAGAKGRAAHFVGSTVESGHPAPSPIEHHALIFSGVNLPSRAGWIDFRLRTDGLPPREQHRRRWIVALPPVVGELYFNAAEVGLGIGLLQDEQGDLVLALHRFVNARLTADYRSKKMRTGMAAPDAIAIRFSAEESDATQSWRRIRIGWDQTAGKVFLGVDDELRSAEVDFPETRFRALILGSPPRILNVQDDVGFSGYLDELIVSAPSASPPESATKPSTSREHAPTDPEAQWAKKVELGVRRHLDLILETQRAGGWSPNVALPSGLHFLSAPAVLPHGDRLYFGMGRASSVVVAMILLRGYEVLGDPRYLKAARSIGDRLLELQNETGTWPGQALLSDSGASVRQNAKYAILKDRTQTMPILLLWQLYDVTGDERYEVAASRGVDFLQTAQNPSGSWPNRVVIASGRRESMSGLEGAGEINDFATSDAMNINLVMYRRTSDVEYLDRYLRGADWLARVFQDGPAKGWAKQYDANDCPITARHHEPVGVAFREMDDVPRTMLEAYLLTGSPRYREILKRWAVYVRSVKDEKGWYPYYDIDTGKPIKRVGGQRVPADPRERRDYGVTRVLARVDRALRSNGEHRKSRPEPAKESERLRRRAVKEVDAMSPRFGSWVSTIGPQGPVMNPNNPRVLVMLHALADAGVGSSSREWDKAWRDEDWRDEFGRVMPSDVLHRRLDARALSAVASVMRKSSAIVTTESASCSHQ